MDFARPIFDRLQDCWDPIADDQFAKLEADLGVRYPRPYRDFLLRFNAGDWSHRVSFRVRQPSLWVNQIHPVNNLGIIPDEGLDYADIRRTVRAFQGRMPEGFVPIMSDGSNPICMATDEKHNGKIYLWDRDNEGVEEDLVYLVADNFTEFVSSLEPDSELERFDEEIPAFQAAERGDRHAITEYLIGRGLCDIRNAKGWTLMMCAAHNSWPRVVDILARAGADPNAVDDEGWTPLHHAVWGQSLDSVKHLLLAGADTSYRDSEGRNLAQIAKELHHYRIYYHLAPYMPYP
jgi:hypothetical protein